MSCYASCTIVQLVRGSGCGSGVIVRCDHRSSSYSALCLRRSLVYSLWRYIRNPTCQKGKMPYRSTTLVRTDCNDDTCPRELLYCTLRDLGALAATHAHFRRRGPVRDPSCARHCSPAWSAAHHQWLTRFFQAVCCYPKSLTTRHPEWFPRHADAKFSYLPSSKSNSVISTVAVVDQFMLTPG